MSKRNVAPFDSLSHLLREALQSAISYDQDLIDCGGYLFKDDELKAQKKVNKLRELLEIVAPGRKTPNEELNQFLRDLIDEGCVKMMTLEELKAAHRESKP